MVPCLVFPWDSNTETALCIRSRDSIQWLHCGTATEILLSTKNISIDTRYFSINQKVKLLAIPMVIPSFTKGQLT